jgi:prophage DNA circulation protein
MSQAISAITQLFGAARTIDSTGLSFTAGTWLQQVQPGSWRGNPFVLDAGETKTGRRVALHEYPYRDEAWAEDLGQLPRRFTVQAFLIGDDVYQQRDAMVAASEEGGSGTLVHPTFGTVEVVLLDFTVTDRRERGRVVEVNFVFVLAGDVVFPSILSDVAGLVGTKIQGLLGATGDDLAKFMKTAVSNTRAAIAGVTGYVNLAKGVVNDATRVVNSVKGLVGFFGRFAQCRKGGLLPATATVKGVLAAATESRSAVIKAAGQVETLARLL